MNNKSFGKKLKEYRKNTALSVNEVHAYLTENGVNVSVKTIYGWENGNSYPSIPIFILLCKYYGIKNITEAFDC